MNNLNRSYRGLEELGAPPPVSRVTLCDDAGNAFTAGDDTGFAIEGDCAWATQAMAEAVLAQLAGYEYRAYTAEGCYLDPAAELGDPVAAGEVYSVIASIGAECGAAYVADIGAPIDGEVDHEFTYEGAAARKLKRTVQLGQTYFGTTITRKDGLVIEQTDGENVSARVTLNADHLAFCRVDPNTGAEVQCFYYDVQTGQYIMTGGVNADEAIANSQPFYDLNLSAYQLTLRMGDAEGNISALEQTAQSLSSTIQDTKTGLQSQITQTASGLQTQVSDLSGKYSRLQQTVDGFDFTGLVTFTDLDDELAAYPTETDLRRGRTTISGDCITTGVVSLEYLDISNGYGSLTIESGSNGVWGTKGPCLTGPDSDIYFIVTNSACRMTAYDNSFYVSETRTHSDTEVDVGSDARLKNSVAYDLAARYEAAYKALKPARFKFNNGTSDRFHTGFIAQDVEQALADGGLTNQDLAALVIGDDGGYAIRYAELIALNTAMIQRLMGEVDELKRKIAELEGR